MSSPPRVRISNIGSPLPTTEPMPRIREQALEPGCSGGTVVGFGARVQRCPSSQAILLYPLRSSSSTRGKLRWGGQAGGRMLVPKTPPRTVARSAELADGGCLSSCGGTGRKVAGAPNAPEGGLGARKMTPEGTGGGSSMLRPPPRMGAWRPRVDVQ
jgi:hypothetical protein